MTMLWNHRRINLVCQISIPDGVYLPEHAQVSEEEISKAQANGLSPLDAEDAEYEWAMVMIAKKAFEDLGIVFVSASAESRGSELREINQTQEGE